LSYTLDNMLSKLAESWASYEKHSKVFWQVRPKNRPFKCS